MKQEAGNGELADLNQVQKRLCKATGVAPSALRKVLEKG
jgi:hypothetical protein